MIFDFVFSEEKILKSEFFDWFISKMKEVGWNYLSEGRPQDDHVFQSSGELGNENIMFQLREYYGNHTGRRFHSSNYTLIGARAIYQYNQNSTITGVGAVKPTSNNSFAEYRLLSTSVSANEYIILNYHINKDRIILIISTANHFETITSSFFVAGKPYHLARYDEYCVSSVIGSHPYGSPVSKSGIYGRGSNTHVHDSLVRFNTVHRGATFGRRYASDITIHNDLDGDKFIVENILVSSLSAERGNKTPTVDMRHDTFIDDLGNIYKQLPVGYTGDYALAGGTILLIKVGVSDEYV